MLKMKVTQCAGCVSVISCPGVTGSGWITHLVHVTLMTGLIDVLHNHLSLKFEFHYTKYCVYEVEAATGVYVDDTMPLSSHFVLVTHHAHYVGAHGAVLTVLIIMMYAFAIGQGVFMHMCC